MRVLHVIGSLDPKLGGPPRVVLGLSIGQALAGATPMVAAYGVDQLGEEAREAREQGVELIDLGGSDGWERVLARRARRRLGQVLADQAVAMVHLHGVWDAVLAGAAGAARRAGTPYAVAPHGMLDPWSLRQGRLKKQLALWFRYRAMLNDAAMLHVLNQNERALIGPLGLRAPFEEIGNGVFLEEIDAALGGPGDAADGSDARARAGFARPYVLFLSRLHFKKGLDVLASAFAGLAEAKPGVDLVVAGPDGGYQATFEGLAAAAGLTVVHGRRGGDRAEAEGRQGRPGGVVRLLGPVYGRAKFELLAGCGCFCLPSRQEGFSMAILEAMACRAPVVITQGCHFPQVAEAGAGLVTPLAASAAAEALAQVLSDAASARAMGQAGRSLVAARYTWQAQAAASLAAYERQIGAAG